jgi:hypothetical protein
MIWPWRVYFPSSQYVTFHTHTHRHSLAKFALSQGEGSQSFFFWLDWVVLPPLLYPRGRYKQLYKHWMIWSTDKKNSLPFFPHRISVPESQRISSIATTSNQVTTILNPAQGTHLKTIKKNRRGDSARLRIESQFVLATQKKKKNNTTYLSLIFTIRG